MVNVVPVSTMTSDLSILRKKCATQTRTGSHILNGRACFGFWVGPGSWAGRMSEQTVFATRGSTVTNSSLTAFEALASSRCWWITSGRDVPNFPLQMDLSRSNRSGLFVLAVISFYRLASARSRIEGGGEYSAGHTLGAFYGRDSSNPSGLYRVCSHRFSLNIGANPAELPWVFTGTINAWCRKHQWR